MGNVPYEERVEISKIIEETVTENPEKGVDEIFSMVAPQIDKILGEGEPERISLYQSEVIKDFIHRRKLEQKKKERRERILVAG